MGDGSTRPQVASVKVTGKIEVASSDMGSQPHCRPCVVKRDVANVFLHHIRLTARRKYIDLLPKVILRTPVNDFL